MSPLALLVWAGFYLATLAILLVGGTAMPWRLNEKVDSDITARVPFEIEESVRTQQERQVASASAPDVYLQNPAPLVSIRGKLTNLLAMVKASAADAEKLESELTAKRFKISDAGLELLKQYAGDEAKHGRYERIVTDLVAALGAEYIVRKPTMPVRKETPRTAVLRPQDPSKGQDREVLVNQLEYISDAKSVKRIATNVAARTFPKALQAPIAELITNTLLGPPGKDAPDLTPLWRYDPAATLDSIKQARDQVPVYTLRKEPGDLLVPAGTTLSNAELELLQKEHEEYLHVARTDRVLRREKLLTQLGMATIVLIITLGLATYSTTYQERIVQKPGRVLGLTGLMVAVILCSRLVTRVPEFSVGFVVIAAMLLAIAYNQRFAFGAGGALAVLVTLTSGGDFGLFLTLMAGMSVAVFALKEVRARSKVVAVGAMAALGSLIGAIATGLIDGQQLKYVLERAAAAAGASLFAGFVVQGILPNFERLFGIATSMTLLEWCDASRPLLRRLAQQAPGTYSHSLVISQMCEEAAEAIGANGLLARVGALYHDIGKTQKADYFVENQEAQMSRHDRLSPTMSLLIITGHVKDGVEMARAYGLPRVLRQFILEHHGTTVVRYFHHAATEAAAKNKNVGKHDRGVPESEFRYPGPKPRSRESAILMLCDGCEGAVRALSEPTPGRIESTVHQVVMARLNDGQFDDCEITLRELKVVERSVVKSLGAIHHGRVKYPTDPAGSPHADTAGQPDPATKPQQEAGDKEKATDKASKPAPEVARQA